MTCGTDVEQKINGVIKYLPIGKNALTANVAGSRNVAIGWEAGKTQANANSNDSVFIGYRAGHVANAAHTGSVMIGSDAGLGTTTGTYNTFIGLEAGKGNTEGLRNIAIGYGPYDVADTENDNIAIGYSALGGSVAGGEFNICIGNYVGDGITSGDSNTAIGHNCMTAGSLVGDFNVTVGRDSLASITDADSNVAVGYKAGLSIDTGDNNICIGREAGVTGSPGGNLTTNSNEIVIGDENITEAHTQVDWTVASDKRDKTDVTNLDLGLDFINKLTPVTYKWDKRSKYIDKDDPSVDLNEVTTDGTHKEDWLDVGFLAQDVAAIEETYNYKISDKTNLITKLSKDGKQYSTSYTKFVPMLVKSIQELTARVKELEDK
jgi:hypothetical protein